MRLFLFLIPLVSGWLAVRFIGPSLVRPAGAIGVVLWFIQAVILASGVAFIVERSTRRFLPLVALLGMSLTFPDQAPSRFAIALRSGTVRQLQTRIDEANKAGLSSEVQTAAAQAVELVGLLGRHERHTRGHTERVRAYADLIAAEMGISVAARQKLAWAALLHDIGKLSVPPEILNKDGKPTPEEWKILQGHPAAGEAFVEPLAGWLGDWRLATSQHHERWDGDGYPAALKGSNISLAGRIVAVADAYDVITAKRSYKPSMSAEAARRELVDCAGKQFDPDVVRAMLAVSVGSKRSSAWFSWMFELPGVSSVISGVAAAPAMTVAAVVGLSTAATVIPVYAATPEAIAYSELVEDESESAGPEVSTTLAQGSESTTTTTTQSQEFPFASDPARPTTSTTATADATVPVTSQPPTTLVPTTRPTTTRQPTTTTTAPTTTNAPTTTTATAPTTTTSTTNPPALTACERLHAGDLNLAGADLRSCDFLGGTFDGVDLSGANLAGADLDRVLIDAFSMDGANLANAELADAEFTNGSMVGVAGNNVDASGARFTRVDLSYSSFTNSDLSDVRITQGSMVFSDLTGTNLAGSRHQNLSYNDAILKSASFENAEFVNIQARRVIAHDSVFEGARLRFTVFNDSEFDRSNWIEADARDASLANTRFVDADLTEANFKWAIGVPTFTETATFFETRCPSDVVQSSDCWP